MTTFVAVIALSCGLTGCAGAPKPKALSTESTSPSPTLSTPTPPAMPAAAKADTKAGAEAFVRHYIELYNYAQSTGSTSALAGLGSAACHSCRTVQAAIERIYRSGGHVDGGEWSVAETEAFAQPNKTWEVDAAGRLRMSTVYATPNSAPAKSPGGPATGSFVVAFGDEWKVIKWTRAS